MNDEQKKTYIAWLNDAHALEESLIDVLEKQIGELDGKPEAKEKLQEHLAETRHHAELVRACLARHGEEPSGGKDIMAKVGAAISGVSLSLAEDTMVKNVHSSYAAEHVEIASYTLIRAAASEFGDMETVAACDEVLVDENDMAQWLLEQLPIVTVEYLREHM
jgi:ferritin-like metal-binding protein YciE